MSKQRVTVFLCQGKRCRKAWHRLTDYSPSKWIQRALQEAGLPYKLHVIETECQDQCDEAACLTFIHDTNAEQVLEVNDPDDADRVVAALHRCATRTEGSAPDQTHVPSTASSGRANHQL